jgi:UV DNA damage endonuclease
MKIGYACINSTLQAAGGITTNRGMRQKTFNEKGLNYVSELALQNCRDLVTIVKWNEEMGIKLFRMSSDLFPWMTLYDFTDLPDYDKIANLLKGVGVLAKKYNHRLTFHPSHFNALGSPNPKVVEKTIKELNKHSNIMDLMGLSVTHYNKINIHVGGAYGDKQSALDRWCNNFDKLSDNTKLRLTIENDDKANMYSVVELVEGITKRTGVPVVFDYYHHKFCTGGLTEQEALELAASTWPEGIVPCTHYSESRRKEHLDESIKAQAHSDLINGPIETYGNSIDVVVEAKHKELAVLNYGN